MKHRKSIYFFDNPKRNWLNLLKKDLKNDKFFFGNVASPRSTWVLLLAIQMVLGIPSDTTSFRGTEISIPI